MDGIATWWCGSDRRLVGIVAAGIPLFPFNRGLLRRRGANPLIHHVSLAPVSTSDRPHEVRQRAEDAGRGESGPCVGVVSLVLWIRGIRAVGAALAPVSKGKEGTYSYVWSSVGMMGGPARDMLAGGDEGEDEGRGECGMTVGL